MTPVDLLPCDELPTGQAAGPDVSGLFAEIARLRALVAQQARLFGQPRKGMRGLRELKFGKRSEKLAPGQLALAFEDAELTLAPCKGLLSNDSTMSGCGHLSGLLVASTLHRRL
jgi:hypothetical protein